MAELTPRDDAKKTVSEILKRVDQLLKGGSLDEAQQQIAKAKLIDPKNVYVFAYEERLAGIIEEKRVAEEAAAKRRVEEEEQRKQEEGKRRVEEERLKKEEEIRRRKEEEEHRKMEERRKADEERRKTEEEKRIAEERERKIVEEKKAAEEQARMRIDAQRKQWNKERGPETRPVPDISREVLEETKRKILDDRKKKGLKAPEPISAGYTSAYAEGLDIYRRVLFEAWADGATTPDEEEQLKSLRASLMIMSEDHDRLDREAKLESYTLAFKRAWSSGAISPESASALADLRKKFRISMEDHEQIEAQLLWDLRSSSQKAQIVIIDDDAKLLGVIADTLQDAGFQTLAFTTSDEAFTALKTATPDMIISDINLETSTMGGFSFYEKVREVERLHDIPFIFLSGLTDEVLIRTGKELGVDDYLTKPFSNDTLIATIKGKLKRYKQLKKSRKSS